MRWDVEIFGWTECTCADDYDFDACLRSRTSRCSGGHLGECFSVYACFEWHVFALRRFTELVGTATRCVMPGGTRWFVWINFLGRNTLSTAWVVPSSASGVPPSIIHCLVQYARRHYPEILTTLCAGGATRRDICVGIFIP